jgi:hypothetical protein
MLLLAYPRFTILYTHQKVPTVDFFNTARRVNSGKTTKTLGQINSLGVRCDTGACVSNATFDSGIANGNEQCQNGDVVSILVLGEFRSTCFVIVQQVPLVLFGNVAPSFGCSCYARARWARSRRGSGSRSLE